MPDSASQIGLTSRVASVAEDLRRRRSELEDQAKELAMLVKQTMAEMDRASQRAREAASQLKQVESNWERFPASDIRRAYVAAQEAQMRQFMMQTQLEQFRNRQAAVESTDQLLRQLAGIAEEILESTEPQEEDAEIAPEAAQSTETARAIEGAGVTFRAIELALQRLSRQLQDETAQTLADLILRAEVCERLVDMDKQKAKTEVTRLKQATAVALKATRQVAQELRSPMLDESGLVPALRRYVETLKAADRLQVDLQVSGPERNLPRAAEVAAFRVVQEALANVAAHSGMKRADLRLRFEPQQLVISVADEGQGFDVDSALQRVRDQEHSGLIDMQARAQLIDGTTEFSSRPGSGCTVTFIVPA